VSVKKGLGRGFESLIPTDLLDESFDPTSAQDEQVSELRKIPLEQIVRDPGQPRKQFDDGALEELADSIREHGILQPIVVVPHASGEFMIVAGERRFRAAKLAGLDKVPALVRTLTDQHRLELSLIENLQRRDLNPLETATAYVKLRDQFNLTLDEIGVRVGKKSSSAVSNTIRLLKLPKPLQTALFEGKLSEGQARPLINIDPDVAIEIAEKIIAEGWSARRVEQWVVNYKSAQKQPIENRKKEVENRPHEVAREQFERRFAAPVKVKTNARGAGQIVISFKSEEEFARLSNLLAKD